jgi:hypothetical protein
MIFHAVNDDRVGLHRSNLVTLAAAAQSITRAIGGLPRIFALDSIGGGACRLRPDCLYRFRAAGRDWHSRRQQRDHQQGNLSVGNV